MNISISYTWIIELIESFRRICSIFKKVYLTSTENQVAYVCESKFWKKKPRKQACNFIKKETLAQVFSCEFFKLSKNTVFT